MSYHLGKCQKCSGMMILEELQEPDLETYETTQLRCLNCGAIIDQTILRNKRAAQSIVTVTEPLTFTNELHLMSLYPLFINDTTGKMAGFLKGMDPMYQDYIEYLMHAYQPKKRDYNKLRRFLYNVSIKYQDTLLRVFKFPLADLIKAKSIDTIIDVGAGHTGYSAALQILFPHAKIIMLDKDDIPNKSLKGVKFIKADAFEYFTPSNFSGNNRILIFMSEFLHCKDKNLGFVEHPELRRCNILVNELDFDPFLNLRLSMTGGKVITWHYFGNKKWSVYKYETVFKYYVAYKKGLYGTGSSSQSLE